MPPVSLDNSISGDIRFGPVVIQLQEGMADMETPNGILYIYAVTHDSGNTTYTVGKWVQGDRAIGDYAVFVDRDAALRFLSDEAAHLGLATEILPSAERVNG